MLKSHPRTIDRLGSFTGKETHTDLFDVEVIESLAVEDAITPLPRSRLQDALAA